MFKSLTPEAIEALHEMDVVEEANVKNLKNIGEKLGKKYVKPKYYADFLRPAPTATS